MSSTALLHYAVRLNSGGSQYLDGYVYHQSEIEFVRS